MMIAAYRMGGQGWSAEQAMKEMHFFGYTSGHHLMCPGLAGYEKSFPERLKESPALRAVGIETRRLLHLVFGEPMGGVELPFLIP
jgi:hypothetical protein